MDRAVTTTARTPAIAPGTPWRSREAVRRLIRAVFAQVTHTLLAPLARVLAPDHPPLRCRWSGIGAVSCACEVGRWDR